MFVNVVVVLSTELVLAARSDGPPCVSTAGAWEMIAGTGLLDRTGSALMVREILLSHGVETPPRATDCRVVVAGFNAGGTGLAMPGPLLLGGGAVDGGGAGV
jgi:hypothetical protein